MNFLLFLFAYIAGSIPTAYILVKKFKNIDITKVGSKNPGTTNVIRSSGFILGFFTFLIDFLKGFIIVFLTKRYYNNNLITVMFFVILGHIFSLFLSFRGGKGVATFFGCIFAISSKVFIFGAILFFMILIISKYVSLSSIISVLFTSIFLLNVLELNNLDKLILIFTVLLIIFRHKDNIYRILKFKENKIF